MEKKKKLRNEHEKIDRQLIQSKNLQAQFMPPDFSVCAPPFGFLPDTRAAHALMYYALLAKKNKEEFVDSPIVLEGHEDAPVDFRQLFKSVAMMYGVQPEEMVVHWQAVDMQFTVMRLPRLNGAQYRFDAKAEIVTVKETKQ